MEGSSLELHGCVILLKYGDLLLLHLLFLKDEMSQTKFPNVQTFFQTNGCRWGWLLWFSWLKKLLRITMMFFKRTKPKYLEAEILFNNR